MAAAKTTEKLDQSQRDDLLTYLVEDDGAHIEAVCAALFVNQATVFRAACGIPVTPKTAALIERGLKIYERQRTVNE